MTLHGDLNLASVSFSFHHLPDGSRTYHTMIPACPSSLHPTLTYFSEVVSSIKVTWAKKHIETTVRRYNYQMTSSLTRRIGLVFQFPCPTSLLISISSLLPASTFTSNVYHNSTKPIFLNTSPRSQCASRVQPKHQKNDFAIQQSHP